MGTTSRLYTINETTGAATVVGSPGGFTLSSLSGGIVGFDVNPVADRIRLVAVNQNIRINPDTGVLAATDTNCAYAVGETHSSYQPTALAIAYNNSFTGAQSTTLYGIEPTYDNLVVIDPPNAGSIHTVGPLGVDTGVRAGFDISGATGTAYASLQVNNVPTLYTINLGTGAATNVGRISTAVFLGSSTINAIAAPTATRVLNLSTRGYVAQGENVLIGGFIARGGATTKLIIRAIGPSLAASGVAALPNPKLAIVNSNGVTIKTNDNWRDAPPAEVTELTQIGIQPTNDLESAVIANLNAGAYTAVVSSSDGNAGIALVEVYQL